MNQDPDEERGNGHSDKAQGDKIRKALEKIKRIIIKYPDEKRERTRSIFIRRIRRVNDEDQENKE